MDADYPNIGVNFACRFTVMQGLCGLFVPMRGEVVEDDRCTGGNLRDQDLPDSYSGDLLLSGNIICFNTDSIIL